jgi:pimeloyl-ACP methyl ester carboxylesterase
MARALLARLDNLGESSVELAAANLVSCARQIAARSGWVKRTRPRSSATMAARRAGASARSTSSSRARSSNETRGSAKGEVMAALNPSIANDPNALEAWGRFMRLAGSPAVAAAVTRIIFDLDIRQILPAISAPTLVVQRRGNPLVPADAGRDVARRIPGAKFVEVPGEDYGFAVGNVDVVIDEVEEFLTGTRQATCAGRPRTAAAAAQRCRTAELTTTPQTSSVSVTTWRSRHSRRRATRLRASRQRPLPATA